MRKTFSLALIKNEYYWHPLHASIQKLVNEKYEPIVERLNTYLISKFSYRRPPADFHSVKKNLIEVRRKKVDLYTRLFDDRSDRRTPTIVIARIGFDKSRKGYGTDLLWFITQIAFVYHYPKIELESCMSVSGIAFANKFGFQRIEETHNYSIDTSELIEYFTKCN